MSTHSAECIPQPLASERRGRTLTRKTSLLRKIEPMARRSGFANRIICNPHSSHDENERRNDPEIVKGRAIARTIQLGSISSLRCQKSRRSLSGESCDMRKCFRGRWLVTGSTSSPSPALTSFAGHASAFSCVAAPRAAEGEAWWSQTGSNRRPHACKARALPAELWPRNQKTNASRRS